MNDFILDVTSDARLFRVTTQYYYVKVYKLYGVKVNFVLIIKSIMFPAI